MVHNSFGADTSWLRRAAGVFALAFVTMAILVFFGQGPAQAAPGAMAASTDTEPDQDQSATDGPTAEADPDADAEAEAEADAETEARLREGQQAYSQICSSCHQPGGAGLPGQYPPLIDNPHVADSAYVTDVIENGRRGEVEVNGEIYDGVMPSFSTLSDEEISAIVAYIQNGFVAPAAEVAIGPTGPVAGTELPALTNMGAIVAYLLAAGVAALVLAPRLLSQNSRLNTPWLDAWLKTAVIVTGFVFLTIVVPDWALKQGAVTKLSRFAQDIIGTTLWTGGLVALLAGLWYAHRESRI